MFECLDPVSVTVLEELGKCGLVGVCCCGVDFEVSDAHERPNICLAFLLPF